MNNEQTIERRRICGALVETRERRVLGILNYDVFVYETKAGSYYNTLNIADPSRTWMAKYGWFRSRHETADEALDTIVRQFLNRVPSFPYHTTPLGGLVCA